MWDVEVLGDIDRLSTFARSRRAHQNDIEH
jgi:hypothetical protein